MMPEPTDDLRSVLDSLSSERAARRNPYSDFGLLENPFPGVGQFIPGISVGQDHIKRAFAQHLQELFRDQRSRRMVISGQTGAGKTNLLRAFERRIREALAPSSGSPRLQSLRCAFINQPESDYLEIHRQLISQLSALFFADFYENAKLRRLDLGRLPAELTGLNPELATALERINPYPGEQLSFLTPSLQKVRTLEDWLKGVKLSVAERKQLGGVTADVGRSSTVAIKLLGDLLRIFSHAGLFRVLIILFDEFEQILATGSRSDQAQYAQDLRNLFDTLPRGVLFVIATSPIAYDLEQLSPALSRRLGQPLDIEPIKDEAGALSYAREYVRAGRSTFEKGTRSPAGPPDGVEPEDLPFYPLKRSQITATFEKLQQQGRPVVPGDLLPELNALVYEIVNGRGAV